MHCPSLGPALLTAAVLAALAAYIVPRGLDARAQLAIADDPARIAERALDEKFNAGLAEREIDAALAAKDADLAQSFIELAATRHVALHPALIDKVKTAIAEDNSVTHTATRAAQGFITGEPDDMASLAGTTLGDLFVFGDMRDAAREGIRLALGERADTMILGLAFVGRRNHRRHLCHVRRGSAGAHRAVACEGCAQNRAALGQARGLGPAHDARRRRLAPAEVCDQGRVYCRTGIGGPCCARSD